MLVNEGHVYFQINSKDPTPENSVKDLFREALYQDVYYDDDNAKLKKKNCSDRYIYNRLQQVFLEGKSNMIAAEDFADLENFEINVFDDYDEELCNRKERLESLGTNNVKFNSVIKSISLLDDTIFKRTILVYLGCHGVLVKIGKNFRLLTEFKQSEVCDIPKDTLKSIIEDNKEINGIIEKIQSNYNDKSRNVKDHFIETVSNFAPNGYEETLRVKLETYFDWLIDETKTTNIHRAVLGDGVAYYGWRVDEKDKTSEQLIDKNKFTEFKQLLIELRDNLKKLVEINQKDMLNYMNISRKIYMARVLSAYKWFVDSYGNN